MVKTVLPPRIFEMNTYSETCAMLEQMEIAEQVYAGKWPSNKIIRADSNRDSHVMKQKEGNPPRLPTPIRAVLTSER